MLCGLPGAPGSGEEGDAGTKWGEGFWFSGWKSSTTSTSLQTGISPGTEREVPAVPGKVTSGSDVLPGSGRDAVQ